MDAKKVWPATIVVVLGAAHLGLILKGLKPPPALDQAIIAALGTLFASRVKGAEKKEGDDAAT